MSVLIRHVGILFLILLTAGPTAAARPESNPGLLKLKVFPLLPRPRSQAPQSVDVRISTTSGKAFSGRLHLKWYLNRTLVHEYVSQELTVVEPGTTLRLIVPQVVARAEKTPISIDGQFVMADGVITFDEESGPTFPPFWKRAFVMAIVQPKETLQRQSEHDAAKNQDLLYQRGLADSLGLEQYNPLATPSAQQSLDSTLDLLTYPSRHPPEDMPTAAVGYTPFDLLFLEGPGFAQLKPRQLTAILQWVTAGGSVVVFPQGKISADHVDFLNRLAGIPSAETDAANSTASNTNESDFVPPGFDLDEDGNLTIGSRARVKNAKYSQYATGLGRSLIVHQSLISPDDFETWDWTEAVCRLWKVRETQLQYIRHKFVEGLQEGRKSRGQWEFQYVQDPRRGLTPLMRPYRPYPDDIPRSLRQFLLPERIEGVPLAVVASILVAYLLCVAPGDYFLLGRLHCRKYTWALFVVISAAFTGSTVLVARNYMGQADYHTSLVIADVVANSSSASEPMIARTTRFDLLFVAQPEMVEIPLRNELYTDLTNLTVQSDKSDTDPNAFWAGSDESEMDAMEVKVTDLPVYSGVIPYAYSVHQQMRQWSPRVNRRTTLGDDRDLLAAVKIPWSNLDAKSWTTEPGRQALLATLEKAVPEATVCLFNRNDLVAIHDPETQTSLPSLMSNSLPTARLATLLSSISNRAPLGFFHVVSQVAPTGGVYLEDLSVLDSSNSRQWLLVVGVKRDNEWLVYRRRYALPD